VIALIKVTNKPKQSVGVSSQPLAMGTQGPKGDPGTNGVDGFSPIVEVTPIDGGHRVSITALNGTQTFDVMDGTGTGGIAPARVE
jgi:hypothetical protein